MFDYSNKLKGLRIKEYEWAFESTLSNNIYVFITCKTTSTNQWIRFSKNKVITFNHINQHLTIIKHKHIKVEPKLNIKIKSVKNTQNYLILEHQETSVFVKILFNKNILSTSH